ncbi:MAG: pyruvate dehydrogenase E2 component (dihydrolipoamide acetyltransferase) [Halieaceae bacterium]
MSQETVLVPDIGGSDAAEVVEVLVAPGDTVEVEQGLLVLESDKASMEIPSTVAGTVLELLAKEGDALGEGDPVVRIEVAGADSLEASGAENTAAAPAASALESAVEPAPQTAAPAPGGAATVPIPVPDIGTDEAVDLIELSVSVGDVVEEGDTLVVLETDKASMEVPSPSAGTVISLLVTEGQQVRQGDSLLELEVTAVGVAAVAPTAPAQAKPAERETPVRSDSPAKPASVAPQPPTPVAAPAADVYAGPAVRKLAREFGVSLAELRGTGPRGRIIKEDLHSYVKRAVSAPASTTVGTGIPPVPEVDFSLFGPVDVEERSKIAKVTAANMQRNWLNVPHVTQFDDADITEMEAFRKSLKAEAEKRGTRLTPIPFMLKACAVALRRHEKINASLSDGGSTLTYKRYVHIGMAVDTPAGLMVPVLRDVDQKTIWELAEEVIEMAGKARDRKLRPADMQGASFTISSLGAIGGRGFTPIVNAPEVAILGVSRAETRPFWDGSAFVPRLQLPLALSYDHRVVNGGDAGRFLTEVCGLLSDIRRLVL